MASSRSTGDQANHAGAIEARHSVGTDVYTVGVANWLPVLQHGNRDAARGSWYVPFVIFCQAGCGQIENGETPEGDLHVRNIGGRNGPSARGR